ncbi:MAG: phosphatidate cytidylyltransferase [Erysipelothrix sp.]|nr:phosphatidate cytidylyltransferase [Erysipelothrix sp.]
MKQRTITGIILAIIAALGILIDISIFKALLYIIVAIACHEIYHLKENNYSIITPILMFLMVFVSTFVDSGYMIIAISIYFILMVLISLIDERLTLNDVTQNFTFGILLAYALKGAIGIYGSAGRWAIVWIFVANFATDIGAYYVGSLIGKHKLIERISPKKTIEGAIGGWLSGFVFGTGFGYFVLSQYLSMPFIVWSSALIPVTAQMGDLFFSMIKRKYNIKDFGRIFPGHGGVLDRIDSIIFSLFAIQTLITIWSLLQ